MTSAAHRDTQAVTSTTAARYRGDPLASEAATKSVAELSAYRIPLRWRDLDHQRHVYHAEYLTLADEGRTFWLGRILNVRDPESYVIVHISVDYLAELKPPATDVEFALQVERVGNKSLQTRETLSVSGGTETSTVVARLTCVFLLWDPETHQARPVTDAERVALGAP